MERPRETISFVSVVYQHPYEVVKRMIESIDDVMQYCPFFDYEIIIWENLLVDINSENETNYQQLSPKLRYFSHADNLGYCGGNNAAISFAKNEYIIVINPDIIITDSLAIDWLVGVSKQYNCISGRLIGTSDWYTYCSSFPTDKQYDVKSLPFFIDEPTLIKPGDWKAFKYIDGCFWCFPKQIWDDVSGFDENIFPGYFGENTFCFKAFLKGYTIKECHFKDNFTHNTISRTPEQSVSIRVWSEMGRKYFYEHYALKNWDKFIRYLNL